MSSADDRLAVQAAADPQAFGELFDRFYARVYNYARYRCDDAAAAEDIAAGVFERLLKSIHTYSPERAPFEAWLFAIARNAVNDYRRAQKLHAWLPWEAARRKPAASPLPEQALLQHEAAGHLIAALRGLSERERELLGLKFNTGLNNRQIAALTGLSESNVGVILYRALGRLRAILNADERSQPGWSEKETGHERA